MSIRQGSKIIASMGRMNSSVDLSDYALKTDIPTNVSAFTNDAGYLTEHQDINGKADKTYVDEELAKKADKSELPTKVSELENDAGYLIAHQDISGKADKSDTYTKAEVDAKVSSVYRFKGSVANYDALPTTGLVIGDVYNIESNGSNYAWDGNDWDKLSETIDLTPYLTKTEASTTYATINDVNGEIAILEGSIGNKADKTAIPTKTSQLTNDSGYLTSHQDISGKANTSLNNLTTAGNEYIDSRIIDIMNNQLSIQMDKVYPVGSLYFGEQATCPMASLISGSTWEKVGSSIITSVNTSVPIKGDGKALGLRSGSDYYGLANKPTTTEFENGLVAYATAYGQNQGNSWSGNPNNMATQTYMGITTDASKSGIVGTVTRTSLTINIFKRTA